MYCGRAQFRAFSRIVKILSAFKATFSGPATIDGHLEKAGTKALCEKWESVFATTMRQYKRLDQRVRVRFNARWSKHLMRHRVRGSDANLSPDELVFKDFCRFAFAGLCIKL